MRVCCVGGIVFIGGCIYLCVVACVYVCVDMYVCVCLYPHPVAPSCPTLPSCASPKPPHPAPPPPATGGVVGTSSDLAVRSLYDALMESCERATAEHAKVVAAAGENAKVPEALLDFFGVPVKADDMLKHVLHMRFIIDKINAMEDSRTFRIDTSVGSVAMGKWSKTCAWSARDDAMLLVGTVRHGYGNFEGMAGDEELGLREKLMNALGPGKKDGTYAEYPKSMWGWVSGGLCWDCIGVCAGV